MNKKPFSFADLITNSKGSLPGSRVDVDRHFGHHPGFVQEMGSIQQLELPQKEEDDSNDENLFPEAPDEIKQIFEGGTDSAVEQGFINPFESREQSHPPGLMLNSHSPTDTYSNNSGLSGNSYISDHSFNSNKSASSQKPKTRKSSVKTAVQGPNYNLQINEDVCLLERIGPALNFITPNHNPFCPLCLKFIDLKKSNFQNVSAYYSRNTKRHYLTHFDCYQKSSKQAGWRIRSLADISESRITLSESSQLSDLPTLNRYEKKMMFLSLEGTHPIGGTMLLRIEKVSHALEDLSTNAFIFFYDFEKSTPSLYEPNIYMIPFPDFVCKITIAMPQVSEDPIIIEFVTNAAAILAGADQNPKNYEIVHTQSGYQAILGIYTIVDVNQELVGSLNYKLPGYEPSISTIDSPKNRFVVLRYLKISIPINKKARVEARKVTSSSLSNLRIDEDEEFDIAASPIVRTQRKKHTGPKETTTLQINNFEDYLSNDAGEKGRTFNSIESPITNKSKNITSCSSISPTSVSESSFFQKTTGQQNQDGYQFSQFATYGNHQTTGSLVLNKQGDVSRGPNSLVLSDTHTVQTQKVITTPNSLSNIDDLRSSPQLQPQKFTKSLSFLPNYETEDGGDPIDPQTFKVSDYQGRIGELAMKPQGSRMILLFIPTASPLEIEMIVGEIIPYLRDIMLDPYSNSMFQKLLQHSTPEQRMALLKSIAPSIPAIARHKKGTHSLQSIVSIIKGEEEEKLIEQSLQDCVLELAKDPYGTHLIQKLVNSLSLPRISFVFNVVICNFVEMAQNPHGLCVLKVIISRLEKDVEKKKLIVQLIARNMDDLIQNAYGNYAIQHTFEVYKEDCKEIWDKITPKAIPFCTQKFSSNVIEKCLETTSLETKKKFIETVAKSERILELMTNKYGNFVLQKLFNIGDENDKKLLLIALNKYYEKIHSTKYRTKWLSFFEESKKLVKSDPSLQYGKQISHDSESEQNEEIFQGSPELITNATTTNTNMATTNTNASPQKKLSLKKSSQSFNIANTKRDDDVFATGQTWQYNQFSAGGFGGGMLTTQVPLANTTTTPNLTIPMTNPMMTNVNPAWNGPMYPSFNNGMQPNTIIQPSSVMQPNMQYFSPPNQSMGFPMQGTGSYSYFPKKK